MGSKHWPFKSQQSSPLSTSSQSGHHPKTGHHSSHISESQKTPSHICLSESIRPGLTGFKEATSYQPQVKTGIRAAGHSKGIRTTSVFHSSIQSRFRSPSSDPQNQPDSSRARPNDSSYQLPSSGSSKKSSGNSSQTSPSRGSMNDSQPKSSKANDFLTRVLNSDNQPSLKKSKMMYEPDLSIYHSSSSCSATQVSRTTLPPKKACQACDCCYKAKTKCSRDLPRCIQCVKRTKCSYTRTVLKKSGRPRPAIQCRIQAHILVFRSLIDSYNRSSTQSLESSSASVLQVGESIMDFSKDPPSPQCPVSKMQP
ncbi:hypothetical protein DSO57_1006310 [Entomophthora muscae]|uniref:Uncharacterized protein n=1 Tax=Entomophthora muscae TaxID=34485 RepID=A0ACC2T7P3_9FUNG|nr:hypothetical protein DSO57_1006310 [Entomophthora muscae]